MKRLCQAFSPYLNNKGNSNAAVLGADLFVTLLIVFIVSTGILLKAPKEATNAQSEAKTPDITLPSSKSEGDTAERGKAVAVSARKIPGGVLEYYVGNERVPTLSDIATTLRKSAATKVELRLQEDLTNATTVRILGQLQAAGIKDVSYIFTVGK